MKKRLLTGPAIAMVSVVIGITAVYAITPADIERSQNKVVPVPLNITPAARALQATLDVADMHADSLLWQRDLLTRSDRGHVDLPRLIEGHYALQVFSSVTKSPRGRTTIPTALTATPSRAWSSFNSSRRRPGHRCYSVRYGMHRSCAALPRTRRGSFA